MISSERLPRHTDERDPPALATTAPAPPHRNWGALAETLATRLFWAVCARLSPEHAGQLGAVVGRCVGRFSRRRDIVRRNLKVAFPERSSREIERLVGDVFSNAGTVFGEYPHLATIADPASERITVSAHPDAPTNEPAICLTPHLANWEVPPILPLRLGVHDITVVYSPRHPAIDARLLAFRRAMGITVISRDNSMLTLYRALKRGGSIGLVADRRDGDGKRLPFFGRQRPVSLIPARLAIKANVPMTTAHTRRVGPGRYHLHLDASIRADPTLPDDEARATAMMMEVNRRYEAYISQSPGDWFCMNRLWNKKITGLPHPGAEP
ncbi:Lauroyl/myristoyl acyltransferase [Arboricoccus pini]|uniref:Lauroyl/myristoyl acyltransferase n=1 Tax=Arboricoccus pini TaxID=1963835 RepID=A0A212S0H8_9PROT|nr:hypothetical protein [Arboricoccus pini]SNB78645.1 Lauroyl/myristoyl acyltransferase [Arboricoccus pini]